MVCSIPRSTSTTPALGRLGAAMCGSHDEVSTLYVHRKSRRHHEPQAFVRSHLLIRCRAKGNHEAHEEHEGKPSKFFVLFAFFVVNLPACQ